MLFYLHFCSYPWPSHGRKCVKRPKLAPTSQIPPPAIKSPGVTLLPLSSEPFFDNFCQVMNISQQRLGDYHFTTEGWGKDASLGFAPKSQAVLGLASTLTRHMGSLLDFSYCVQCFFAPTLPPSSKQNIKGVTGKNSNTVFVTKCDSNVVKRRGQQAWQEC